MNRIKTAAADWIVAAIACIALGAIAANESLPKHAASAKPAAPYTRNFNHKGTYQA